MSKVKMSWPFRIFLIFWVGPIVLLAIFGIYVSIKVLMQVI